MKRRKKRKKMLDSPPPDLRASRVVMEGAEMLILSFRLPPPELPASFTRAERLVACAILEGKSNEQIARERNTSVRTVANQVASVFRKLGVHSRGEVAAKLFRDDTVPAQVPEDPTK
jgi:DNA-binding NarL/FixJ family response regulator